MSRLVEVLYSRRTIDSNRRVLTLKCPYCECVIEAYVSSLSGTGKRCECKRVFRMNNQTGMVSI